MKRVVATGTFDGVHKGHEFFLREAKKLGDWLGVVVALDSTVERIKGSRPKQNQNERHMGVEALHIADVVVLGYEEDKLKIIEELDPDIIALGYDQTAFTDKLKEQLNQRGITTKVIRISSFKPEKYKSSIMNGKHLQNE